MLSTPDEQLACPSCKNGLGPLESLQGQKVRCRKCQATLRVDGEGRITKDHGVLWSVLDKLESLLVKMIRGAFYFTFVRVPRWVYDILVEWFSSVIKAVRVLILAVLWLVIVVIPGLFAFLVHEGHTASLREAVSSDAVWLSAIEGWFGSHGVYATVVAYTWSGLALVGSVWGAVHLRRRRRRAARPS